MAYTAQNWTLASYTTGAWTDILVATGPTIVKGIVISVGGTPSVVGIRIVDAASAVLAVLTPGETLAANLGHTADVPTIILESGQKLQVVSDVTGCTFSVHGAAA